MERNFEQINKEFKATKQPGRVARKYGFLTPKGNPSVLQLKKWLFINESLSTKIEEKKEELLEIIDELKQNEQVDIVIYFDTTGSMRSAIDDVVKNAKKFVSNTFDKLSNIRIGVLAGGDYWDGIEAVHKLKLTNNKQKILDFLNPYNSSGQDNKEYYELMLRWIREKFEWKGKRIVIFISDAPPHSVRDYKLGYIDGFNQLQSFGLDKNEVVDWEIEVAKCKESGIKIYSIYVESFAQGRNFSTEIAERTGGKMLEFSDFKQVSQYVTGTIYAETNQEELKSYITTLSKSSNPINQKSASTLTSLIVNL